MPRMLGMRSLPPSDPQGLSPEVAALIAQLQQQVQDQAQQLSERDQALAQRDALLVRKDREIALREAKIEKINFELARLKRWTYGAKSEAMNADQRRCLGLGPGGRRGRRGQAQGSAAQAPSQCLARAPAPRGAPS